MPPRKPLSAIKNSSHPPAPSKPKPTHLSILQKAIATVDAALLRDLIQECCATNKELFQDLSKQLLVKGKEIVRYHVDTEDENAEETEDEEVYEQEEDEEDNVVDGGDVLKPVCVGHDELTARHAMCENCKVLFDVTNNYRGACVWHPGTKSADYESDFWADHDEDCHGRIDDLIDEPDMAEGFTWDCCDHDGSSSGCKNTKHKAPVNRIMPEPVVAVSSCSKKRKAEEDIGRSGYKR